MNQTATQAEKLAASRAAIRRRSSTISVSVDVDVQVDEVLEQVSTEALVEELESRADAPVGSWPTALSVYEYFALHGGAPPILREYLMNVTGRILP